MRSTQYVCSSAGGSGVHQHRLQAYAASKRVSTVSLPSSEEPSVFARLAALIIVKMCFLCEPDEITCVPDYTMHPQKTRKMVK